MAYWLRKGDGRIYVYTRYVNGVYQKKPKQIRRAKVSQLDAQSDTQIEQWVKDYESRWEKNSKFQPEQILLSDELLSS